MSSMNVLSTNIGYYLTMRKTLRAAKDCIKHFGQGERVRFELYVYPNPNARSIRNPAPVIYKDLPYSDPFGKTNNTLLGIVYSSYKFLPKGTRYKIFATRYVEENSTT